MDKYDRLILNLMNPLYDELALKSHLTKDEKEIFFLRELMKWSVVKTSLTLHYSEATIKRKYRSARHKLNLAL